MMLRGYAHLGWLRCAVATVFSTAIAAPGPGLYFHEHAGGAHAHVHLGDFGEAHVHEHFHRAHDHHQHAAHEHHTADACQQGGGARRHDHADDAVAGRQGGIAIYRATLTDRG